jgi:hypothetical protein
MGKTAISADDRVMWADNAADQQVTVRRRDIWRLTEEPLGPGNSIDVLLEHARLSAPNKDAAGV